MSALVGYGSSDEDEAEPLSDAVKPELGQSDKQGEASELQGAASKTGASPLASLETIGQDSYTIEHDEVKSTRVEGNGMTASKIPSGDDAMTAIRNLTLPTVPNLDIPGSPPGSPPELMTQKVQKFLQLKQQGIHFNEKMALSSSLKNPSLFGKLSVFAGLEPEDQYATSLPVELWNPHGFPSWAYKDELGRAQEQAVKLREHQRSQGLGSGVEFVKGRQEVQNSDRARKHSEWNGDGRHDYMRTEHARDLEHRRRSRSPNRRRD